jgi:hypothetical protein
MQRAEFVHQMVHFLAHPVDLLRRFFFLAGIEGLYVIESIS